MPSVGEFDGDGRRDGRFTDAALPHRHHDTVPHLFEFVDQGRKGKAGMAKATASAWRASLQAPPRKAAMIRSSVCLFLAAHSSLRHLFAPLGGLIRRIALTLMRSEERRVEKECR